jgi:hypothetical protein
MAAVWQQAVEATAADLRYAAVAASVVFAAACSFWRSTNSTKRAGIGSRLQWLFTTGADGDVLLFCN